MALSWTRYHVLFAPGESADWAEKFLHNGCGRPAGTCELDEMPLTYDWERQSWFVEVMEPTTSTPRRIARFLGDNEAKFTLIGIEITKGAAPVNALSAYQGEYRDHPYFYGCDAIVDNHVKNGADVQEITVYAQPALITAYYSAVRCRAIEPVVWYEEHEDPDLVS